MIQVSLVSIAINSCTYGAVSGTPAHSQRRAQQGAFPSCALRYLCPTPHQHAGEQMLVEWTYYIIHQPPSSRTIFHHLCSSSLPISIIQQQCLVVARAKSASYQKGQNAYDTAVEKTHRYYRYLCLVVLERVRCSTTTIPGDREMSGSSTRSGYRPCLEAEEQCRAVYGYSSSLPGRQYG